MYKIIELFSGNADITKRINQETDLKCFSCDYEPKYNANLICDVYKLTDQFFKNFDFIWLSPDCTTYSIASHGIHRSAGGVPKSEYAKYCDQMNEKLINKLIELDIPFIIENPRGHFRNMNFIKKVIYQTTVYYSSYGLPYAKPTDLFSNRPIEMYFNTKIKNTHVRLDRVISNSSDFLGRCKMPALLIEDIIVAIKEILKNERR